MEYILGFCPDSALCYVYIDGSVPDCSISIAYALNPRYVVIPFLAIPVTHVASHYWFQLTTVYLQYISDMFAAITELHSVDISLGLLLKNNVYLGNDMFRIAQMCYSTLMIVTESNHMQDYPHTNWTQPTNSLHRLYV